MPASSPARRRSPPGKVARRWLFLIHRWIGIASCLLFAMWFVSGLVMIYLPYPSLSPAQKLAGAEPIDWAAVDVPPPVGRDGLPRSLALEMRDGVPVWRIEEWSGARRSVSASQGVTLRPPDAAMAMRVAARFGHTAPAGVEVVERDQWTVAGGFDQHRPLWKVRLGDRAGTELYVSSSTGGVVQATTRSSRFWNWLGSVPHWLYPTILREDGAAWRQVVIWVSGPCIAAALAGLWIGILRTRPGQRRFKGGRMTPYHGWMLWHHVAGMVGGLFLLAWIFSGWLSVDPGRLFRDAEPPEGAMRRYAAGAAWPAIPLDRLRSVAGGPRLVRFSDDAGLPRVAVYRADGTRAIFDARSLSRAVPDEASIARVARGLVPDGHLVRVERLTTPDAYWYEVGALPRLPILRLHFDDPARTWLHVDPETGAVLDRLDTRRRLYRWLFDLLHKWDFNLLTLHRPIWDLLLWGLSALGLITSVSGVWIGWKRLTRA